MTRLFSLKHLTGYFTVFHNEDSSLHRNLKQSLADVFQSTKDAELNQVIKQVQASYKRNKITDLLAVNLLNVEAILLKKSNIDRKSSLPYAEILVLAFEQLTPKKEHPFYATSLHNLAELYYHIGQKEKALHSCEQALAIREKVIGIEHPDWAESINNLAFLYQDMKQYEQALPLFEKAKEVFKQTLGKSHPNYSNSIINLTTCLNNLAESYKSKNQNELALSFFERASEIWKAELPQKKSNYAASLNNSATTCFDMGLYGRAVSYLEKSVSIWEEIVGEDHPNYKISLTNLAITYAKLGQNDKAEEIFTKISSIEMKELKKNNRDAAMLSSRS